MTPIRPGTVWQLKSGSLVLLTETKQRDRSAGYYVDHRGKPLKPAHKNCIVLANEFLQMHAKPVNLTA